MPVIASNLQEAANESYAQLSLAWAANTLDTTLESFISDINDLFSDTQPNARPVGNWLVLLQALVSQMPSGAVAVATFSTAVEYVYRMCMAAASAESSSLIPSSAATAMLDVWNDEIGAL